MLGRGVLAHGLRLLCLCDFSKNFKLKKNPSNIFGNGEILLLFKRCYPNKISFRDRPID